METPKFVDFGSDILPSRLQGLSCSCDHPGGFIPLRSAWYFWRSEENVTYGGTFRQPYDSAFNNEGRPWTRDHILLDQFPLRRYSLRQVYNSSGFRKGFNRSRLGHTWSQHLNQFWSPTSFFPTFLEVRGKRHLQWDFPSTTIEELEHGNTYF